MLSDIHKRDNLQFVDAFGGRYPAWFKNPTAEYQAITRYTGALDLTHWRIFTVKGRDRVSFLNAMVTSDVALDADRGSHAVLTTIKGKIVAEMFAFVREDDVLLQVSQGDAMEALAVLQKHIIMDDVTIEDVSDAFGVLALEGPKAEEVLWRIFDKGPFPKEALQAYPRTFNDADVYLTRNSVTGNDGYHLMVPAAFASRVWDYLVQGARGSDGLAVGHIAWNMARAENGLPWYGVDFDADNFPDECRLGHTVSYTKGCFRGQETLARLHHRGHVNKMLVGLVPDEVPTTVAPLVDAFAGEINNYDEARLVAEAPALASKLDLPGAYRRGAELTVEGGDKPVGQVTTAVYSPRLQKPLVLGYVRREVVEGDRVVLLDGACLRVVSLPLSGESS